MSINLVELGSKASSVLSSGKLSVNLLSNLASRRSKVLKHSCFISSAKVVVRFPDSMKFFPSVKFVRNCIRCLVIFWILQGLPFWPTEEGVFAGPFTAGTSVLSSVANSLAFLKSDTNEASERSSVSLLLVAWIRVRDREITKSTATVWSCWDSYFVARVITSM